MGSLVLTTLTIFLGLFFLFLGSMKVTPGINKEMHREIRKNFIQYSKVFPLTKSFGFKVPSKWYRLVVGWLEVACGTTLLLIPGFAKQVANILLLMVMLAAFYSHVMLSEKFERMAPSIVFSLMLCCRMVVFWQIKRKERKALEKLAALKTTSYAAKPDEAIAGPSKETKVD